MKKLDNVADIYPLTPTQTGILFHALNAAETGVYFEQLRYDYHGELNPTLFKQAFERLLDRHPIFRTMFVWDGVKEPLQIVRKTVEAPLEILDWRGRGDQEAGLETLAAEYRHNGIALTKAPVVKAALIRLTDQLTHFIWNSHHILLDGWSSALAQHELMTTYEALHAGREPRLQPVRPFKQYVAWLKKQDPHKAEAFWSKYLDGHTEPAHLPNDPIPSAEFNEPGKRAIVISSEVVDKVKRMIQAERLTINTVIQAAWGLVIRKWTGQNDIVYGGTVSGRPAELPHVESIIGMFISTLPVRVQIDPAEPVIDWLKRLQREQVEVRQYEYSSLSEIHSWSDLTGGGDLFNSILVFENFPIEETDPQRAIRSQLVGAYDQSNYALDLMVFPGDEIHVNGIYDQDKFLPETVDLLLRHLGEAIEQIADSAEATVGDLGLGTVTEQSFKHAVPSAGRNLLDAPQEVLNDPARLVRYLAIQRTESVTLTADQLGSLINRFADFERRVPHLKRITAVSQRPGDRFDTLSGAFKRIQLDYQVERRAVPLLERVTAGPNGPAGYPKSGLSLEIVDSQRALTPAGIPGTLRQVDGDVIGAARWLADGRIELIEPAAPVEQDASAVEAAAAPAETSEQAEALLRLWTEVLDVESISLSDNFFDLGGHSTMAVVLFSKMKQQFQIDLPLATLLKSPTPQGILDLMNGKAPVRTTADLETETALTTDQRYSNDAWLHLVQINAGNEPVTPFFCVHGAGGNVLNFRDLSGELGEDRPFYGLQAAGVDGIQPPAASFDEMVESYLDELVAIRPAGPVILGGYSGGGVVAYEMAQRLKRQGRTVEVVVLFDSFHPDIEMRSLKASTHLKYLMKLGPKYIRKRLNARRREKEEAEEFEALWRQVNTNWELVPFELRDGQLTENLYQILRVYEPEVYDGPVIFLAAEKQYDVYAHVDDKRGWSELIPNMELIFSPGDHLTLVDKPNIDVLGPRLKAALTRYAPTHSSHEMRT